MVGTYVNNKLISNSGFAYNLKNHENHEFYTLLVFDYTKIDMPFLVFHKIPPALSLAPPTIMFIFPFIHLCLSSEDD